MFAGEVRFHRRHSSPRYYPVILNRLPKVPAGCTDLTVRGRRMVRNDSLRRHVTMKFELSPSLPAVLADGTQLYQVVLNLIRERYASVAGARGRMNAGRSSDYQVG